SRAEARAAVRPQIPPMEQNSGAATAKAALSAQYRLGFRNGAEHVIERRRRNGRYRRASLAVECVVPAAGDGMAEIVLIETRQGVAGFGGGTRLARLRLRDPGFCHFGLRPATPAAP